MEREISTGDLLKSLYKAGDIEEYFNDHMGVPERPSFSEYVKDLCKSRGEIPEHVIKRSGIDRTYGHQIFNHTRKPSRDKVIQLAIAFGLNVEETQKMLRVADKSELYPRVKRDAMLLYCITHEMGYEETQKALMLYKLQPLGE